MRSFLRARFDAEECQQALGIAAGEPACSCFNKQARELRTLVIDTGITDIQGGDAVQRDIIRGNRRRASSERAMVGRGSPPLIPTMRDW